MSVIQDALKKAQSTAPQADPGPKLEQVDRVRGLKPEAIRTPKPTKQSSAIKKRLLIATAVLTIVAVLIFIAVYFSMKDSRKSDKASSPLSPQASYRPLDKGQINVAGTASPANALNKATPPVLVLNGIMYIEESPKALINNFIVEPGDLISGATVKQINRQNVILEYGDTEITLNLM